MNGQKPKVGIGVLIAKDGKILLGKRKGSHGSGEYSFPGGHLEYMESFEECARRETREECGMEIENVRFQFVSNTKKYSPNHYVHIGLVADWKSGDPKILEPDKCESWGWYDMTRPPEPMFELSKQGIDCFKSGKNYFDAENS